MCRDGTAYDRCFKIVGPDLSHHFNRIYWQGCNLRGKKPDYILEGVTDRKLFSDPVDHLVFVDDGPCQGCGPDGQVYEFPG